MTVKIVKVGKNLDDFYGVCRHCGTEFTCNMKDGKYIKQPSLRPHEGGYLHINCPYCGRGCVAYPNEP